MSPLHRLRDVWAHRSPRERRLAGVVAVLFCVLGVLLLVKGALDILGSLDREISQLSDQVLNNARMLALRKQVDARFAEVANQHSSAWTESEIRDRLRQEIYRLSNRIPPGLDDKGIPLSTSSDGGFLVQVPELGGGRLVEGGEGYRAYQIEFSVPPVPLLDLSAYLERLMESPQSLRIDRVDLRRDPERTEFAADLVITRTVVDNPGGVQTRSQLDTDLALQPDEWRCQASTARREASAGPAQELVLEGNGAEGSAFLAQSLPTSGICEVTLELASTSEGQIGVTIDGAPLKTQGDTTIRGDGRFYRYRFQFVPLAKASGSVSVQCPVLTWTQPDARLRVRRLIFAFVETRHAN